jgi:hypothetical protein
MLRARRRIVARTRASLRCWAGEGHDAAVDVDLLAVGDDGEFGAVVIEEVDAVIAGVEAADAEEGAAAAAGGFQGRCLFWHALIVPAGGV